MATSRTFGIGLAFCSLIGIIAGGMIGWYFGTGALLNSWVREQAGDVNGDLEVLRSLKAGDTAAAVEFVESGLDDDLVSLRPGNESRLKPHIYTEMVSALQAAKQYRTQHPRKSHRTSVDAMVRNALSEIPD